MSVTACANPGLVRRAAEACWMAADLDDTDYWLPEAAPARRLLAALGLRKLVFRSWSYTAQWLEQLSCAP